MKNIPRARAATPTLEAIILKKISGFGLEGR
jgi:hypothetical protein